MMYKMKIHVIISLSVVCGKNWLLNAFYSVGPRYSQYFQFILQTECLMYTAIGF